MACIVLGPYTAAGGGPRAVALIWTIFVARDCHAKSGGLLVVSFLTSVAIGMALELGRLLLNRVVASAARPRRRGDPDARPAERGVVARPRLQTKTTTGPLLHRSARRRRRVGEVPGTPAYLGRARLVDAHRRPAAAAMSARYVLVFGLTRMWRMRLKTWTARRQPPPAAAASRAQL